MANRRASTIELILLSAIVYAAIPVVLSELDTELVSSFPVVMIGLKVLIALPVVLTRFGWTKLLQSLRDWEVFWLASTQALFFVLSLLFLALSLSMIDVPVAIVIAETWPIPAAIAMGVIMSDQLKRLTFSELIWGTIAFVGVILVLDLPGDIDQISRGTWTGAALALASAATMGLSAALKARAVRRMKSTYQIGPFLSYFLLQFFFLPALPLFLAYQYFFAADSAVNQLPLDVFLASLPLVSLIVFLNFTSSVLYSFATLKLERTSDGFVWFFTPAFSLLLFSIYTGQALKAHELIGLTFILSSNLLLTIAADTSRSFKALILTTLGTGSVCYFMQPVYDSTNYFDAIAILSIFFVVILSEGWRQIASHSDREEALLLDINHEMQKVAPDLHTSFDRLVNQTHPTFFKRNYHALRRTALQRDLKNLPLLLDRLAHARNRSVQLGKFVSLSACVIATAAIGLLARPDGWLTSIFITVYLPSMVFSLFILIEGHLGNHTLRFRASPAMPSEIIVRILAGRAPRDSVIWSLLLSGFIILTYAYALGL